MDYRALHQRVSASPDDHAELLDYAAVHEARNPLVRMLARRGAQDLALAMAAFLRRDEFDAIFTNAESVAIPLCLLLRTAHRRPRHVTIGHRLAIPKKAPFFKLLRLHELMDTILVYSSVQERRAIDELGIPARHLRRIHFQVDHRFFRPLPDVEPRPDQICSAGLEWRDYPTLINALRHEPHVQVRLAAASPWSAHTNETERVALPDHIQARRYSYVQLRELYAQSALVVVPLYPNDFQAGITTMLEAMAMGKAVVVSRTEGQVDVIDHGDNGLYVAPQSSEQLREVVQRLLGDHTLRAELGRRARRWVEENATIDTWVDQVVAALRGERAVDPPLGLPRSNTQSSCTDTPGPEANCEHLPPALDSQSHSEPH
jgi:glycosyltransferase involved in cell wall biosynthesis